jgi:hypothetical protein
MRLLEKKDEQYFLQQTQSGNSVHVDVVDGEGKKIQSLIDINGGNIFFTPLTRESKAGLGLDGYQGNSVWVWEKNDWIQQSNKLVPEAVPATIPTPTDEDERIAA